MRIHTPLIVASAIGWCSVSIVLGLQPQHTVVFTRPATKSHLPRSLVRDHRQISSSSPLFSLPSSKFNDNDGGDESNPKRKRDVARAFLQTFRTRAEKFRNACKAALKENWKNSKARIATLCIIALFYFGDFKHLPTGNSKPAPISPSTTPVEVPYSRFMDMVEGKERGTWVRSVELGKDHRLRLELATVANQKSASLFKRLAPTTKRAYSEDEISTVQAYTNGIADPNHNLVDYLRKHGVSFASAAGSSVRTSDTSNGLATAAMVFLAYRLYQNTGGALGGATSGKKGPGKRRKNSKSNTPRTSFDDIQGIDKAKDQVLELVDTLRNPQKYQLVGARPPTGLLLEGPPGTGKTTLARAAASLADVPLLFCSGSDFVEMYVGKGAARVRQLFQQAAAVKGPCLIFIDEIDALGKSRGRSGGNANGGRDEAEQTLNQLLTCMDGLEDDKYPICVMAATNRRDVLDPALLRPGRFDRIIYVDLPNAEGRLKILRSHASKLVGFQEMESSPSRLTDGSLGSGKQIDLHAVAEATDGLSGAELECIVNEAAIRAVRRVSEQLKDGKENADIDASVYATDFEESIKEFMESRKKEHGKNKKNFGIVIPDAPTPPSQKIRRHPNQIFFKPTDEQEEQQPLLP